jgi:hypothetical protein
VAANVPHDANFSNLISRAVVMVAATARPPVGSHR